MDPGPLVQNKSHSASVEHYQSKLTQNRSIFLRLAKTLLPNELEKHQDISSEELYHRGSYRNFAL